jgi:hypothetical protein
MPFDGYVHAKAASPEILANDARTAGIDLISATRHQFVNGSFWPVG